MPFINQDKRSDLNGLIKDIENTIRNRGHKTSSSLAYVIYKLLVDCYTGGDQEWEFLSVPLKILEDVKLVYFAEFMIPHAKRKITENGDIR